MKVKDIIVQALIKLGIADRYDMSALSVDDVIISLLIRCINSVISEIASDYIEVRKVEELTAKNGMIDYQQFGERVINVKRASSKSGDSVTYRMYPEYLQVEKSGELTIEYCYLPATVSINDDIVITPRVTELLIVNGVLGEYCLINGRYEDSMFYDKRYREMLKLASMPTHEIRVKGRHW